MTGGDETIPKNILQSLKGSGFPFQTAIADVLRCSEGWSIHASEYPWRASGDEDRFLDLIAVHGMFFLTIECKKTRAETWTFLQPVGPSRSEHIADFRCLHVDFSTPILRRDTAMTPPEAVLSCQTLALWPKSPCSEFCIVGTSKSGRDQRLLERDAGLLIGGTDAFAENFRQRLTRGLVPSRLYVVIPVIVTNAKLYLASYNPSEVSLETGEFQAWPKRIEESPWIRFSKAFTTGEGRDLGARSIFVVSASLLEEFLQQHLEMAPQQPGDTVLTIIR